MDLQQYQKHARRTLNDELGPQTQLANLTLGTVGEFSELKKLHIELNIPTKEQILDEGGDVLWYLANLCNVLTLDLAVIVDHDNAYIDADAEILIDEAAIYYGSLADITKKTIAQGHVLDIEAMVFHICELYQILEAVAYYYGLTIQEVCEYNHLKLMRRYPNGFESNRSVNREV